MDFDFRPLRRRTFADRSRKYPSSQTLAISGGRIEGKANTRGLGVWLLQSLPFGNLAAACGASFLTLQKASLGSDSGRCKMCFRTMVFGCREASPLEARLLPMKPPHRQLNQNQTEILRCPSPARPRAAVGGSP